MMKYAAGGDALRQEKLRQERLEQAGFVVVRWTNDEITWRPHHTARRILRGFETPRRYSECAGTANRRDMITTSSSACSLADAVHGMSAVRRKLRRACGTPRPISPPGVAAFSQRHRVLRVTHEGVSMATAVPRPAEIAAFPPCPDP